MRSLRILFAAASCAGYATLGNAARGEPAAHLFTVDDAARERGTHVTGQAGMNSATRRTPVGRARRMQAV